MFFAVLAMMLCRFQLFPWLFGYTPPFGFTWARAFELAGVSVLFYSILTYFLVSDFLQAITRTLFRARGLVIGPFGMTIRAKIVTALVMGSALPLSIVTLDVLRLGDAELINETWASVSASLIGLAFAVWFITRSLTGPVANLVAGVREVGEGALDTRIPVISNDELGQLTWDFNAMVEGLKERAQIRETFGRYVSDAVAERLISDGGNLAGEVRTATVMFTDIENFTGITERLAPEQTIALLNEYLAVIAEPIERHGGVINNFIGDALFVTFNLPLEDPDHADNAVRAAQAIQRALEGRTFGGDGIRLITRIGLNTGPVVAGTIGAGARLGYTALGDTVNLAARAEKLNKQFGTHILATEATVQACRAPDIFAPLGETGVRNREQPVRVFRLKDA
jgi:class 3 adenylate cyclase